jgi:hypothetical protein
MSEETGRCTADEEIALAALGMLAMVVCSLSNR